MNEQPRKKRRLASTLTYLVFWLWATVMVMPVVVRQAQQWMAPAQWMEVELSFDSARDRSGWPYVIFRRTIHREFSTDWYGWVEEVNPEGYISRVCGGIGSHAYSPVDTGTYRIGADYFLGRACEIPEAPFRVCKRWLLDDAYGLKSTAGPACTNTYTGER